MPDVSLATLRTRSRQRADMENSRFISESELTTYINASYFELYDLLVATYEDYYTIPYAFTVASDSAPLPTDFYKLRGVDKQIDDNDTWQTITKFNFQQRNINDQLVRKLFPQPVVQYRITGNTLYFIPLQNAAGPYRLWYIPMATPMVADSDVIQGVNGWEEYVVIDAAIKMLGKEESSTTDLVREKNAMRKRIQDMAPDRDTGQPEQITIMADAFYDGIGGYSGYGN